MLSYNQCIGSETIDKEFKEFSILTTMDINKLEYYCLTNIFSFNNLVINNIKRYFNDILPKYISSFINSKINGTLYIGINDCGILKGVPYNGFIPKYQLIKELYISINNFINFDFQLNYKINEIIDIEFQDIQYNETISDIHFVNSSFIRYLIAKNKYLVELNVYSNKYEIWKKKYEVISQRIANLGNNTITKELIINYIKSIDKSNPAISILENITTLEHYNHSQITCAKSNINSPYYWITEWKDIMMAKIQKEKPKFNKNFKESNIPYYLFQHFENMIPYWYKYNKNLKLYLIKINIKGSLFKDNDPNCYYYNKILNKWSRCKRVVSKTGEPSVNHY